MYIEQIYTACLAEASYYVESDGEAAIIDPMRDITPYLELAAHRNATIRYVLETHFHADFVSGHLELARQTDAAIIFGPGAKPGYAAIAARPYEKFHLGRVTLQVLHTPGHTLESACFLLLNDSGTPEAVFTGDTLFVGEVGRPDLAVNAEHTAADLAGMLFESLRREILTLPDDVVVYPGHGPGSACGKNIGPGRSSTIGEQRKLNYALQFSNKEEFVANVLQGMPAPPTYFFLDARLNREGYENLESVQDKSLKPLDANQVGERIIQGMTLLDTRSGAEFSEGFIAGSVHIGLDGQFASWAGTLLDPNAKLVLVCQPGQEEETVIRLARIGYHNVAGYLQGGIGAWTGAGNTIEQIQTRTAEQWAQYRQPDEVLLDVRNPGETLAGIVEGANCIPLNELQGQLSNLNPNDHYTIYCAGGYRSLIAASLLHRAGFRYITNIAGGMNSLRQAGVKIVLPLTA